MIGKRQSNDRLYPDAGKQPRHKSKYRREEAIERQAAYDALTLQEKIARLPPEPFSTKQRKKLMAQLIVGNSVKSDVQDLALNKE